MATVASISYFKRYKMEVDLHALPAPRLPDGFSFAGWRGDLLDVHAEVLFGCFQQEIDAQVFPSLGDRQGVALPDDRDEPQARLSGRGDLAADGTGGTVRHRAGHARAQRPGIDSEPRHSTRLARPGIG